MRATIHIGDALDRLRNLRDECVQCVVTSPPYWGLRDYGTALWEGGEDGCEHRANGERRQIPHGDGRPVETDGYAQNRTLIAGAGANFKDVCGKCGAVRVDAQLGLEKTPEEYIARMVEVFGEVRRVLRGDGTLWLNMGDSYSSGGRTSQVAPPLRTASGKHEYLQNFAVRPGTAHNCKPKDLIGIPWMLAFALRADGWYLRQDIIWSKPNPMPESVTDRCTKAHEYLFLLTKSARYYWDQEAIAEAIAEASTADHPAGNNSHKGTQAYLDGDERQRTKAGLVDYAQRKRQIKVPGGWDLGEGAHGTIHRAGRTEAIYRELGPKGTAAGVSCASGRGAAFGRGAGWRDDPRTPFATRNKRSVWEIATQPFAEAHFATFPEKLVEPCILAGSKPGDVVFDPFCGSGTVGVVALRYHRDFVGIELNPEYAEMAERRIGGEIPLFAGVEVVRPKLAAVAGD